MKNILITGAGSYIGDSVKEYLDKYPELYNVTIKDTIGWRPDVSDFGGYDVVFHVAGIAHKKETKENAHLYYEVNRDQAIRVAEQAKAAGARQFIIMSSMSVYGMNTGHITKETKPAPQTHYGKSKLQADRAIWKMRDDSFKVAVLRPPMVYGKNCKGNYQHLRSFVLKTPIFPDYPNRRSMLYIGNLCEFVKDCIDNEAAGLFFTQNAEYVNTSEMVRLIARGRKKVRLTKAFNWAVKIAPFKVIKKIFGNLTYEAVDLVNKYDFKESIRLTEE